jgi:hypothetical protein
VGETGENCQRGGKLEVHPDTGFEKFPWRKVHKGSNGINTPVKLYLNHGPQETEIYISNIPGVSNMIT